MSLMVSISGIRGVVGTDLTPEAVVRYASAFAEYCGRGPIVLGRDGRVTGKSIGHLVSSTLLQMGTDVMAIGICPTPTVALAVEKKRAAGGISITASHNPMEWNGLKFFAPSGLFLDAEQNKEFWKFADVNSRAYATWNKQGAFTSIEAFRDYHVQSVLRIPWVRPAVIRKRRFKIVLDCVNAAGGTVVPQLLRALGVRVVEMNCNVSGIFSHTPEPVPENLTSLCSRVKKERANLGIAVDPDVDRLVLIDEKGAPFGEEYTIATAVRFILDKLSSAKKAKTRSASPSVVVNLSTTRAVDTIAQHYGAHVIRTPVGEINVAKKMREIGAVIGGEGSGGVIYPESHLGRDALVGIAIILQQLAEFDGTLSELKQKMPQYSITKGKVAVGDNSPETILGYLAIKYREEGKINQDDGLKIDFPDSWVHLRKSNTEPIVRIIAEASNASEAKRLVERFTFEISQRA